MSAYTNLKQSLAQFINSLKSILSMRPYLTLIDLHSLQNNNAKLFQTFLGLEADELWREISQGQERIGQTGIMRILVNIIKKLTFQKTAFRERSQMRLFQETRGVVEWLEGEVVGVEELVRKKMREGLINERKEEKVRKEGELEKESSRLAETILMKKKLLERSISDRHSQQQELTQRTIDKEIEKRFYEYKPSKKLSQAKDTTLLIKLAPFKNEKNRDYENRSLQKELLKTIEEGKVQVSQKVDAFRKKQRQKIVRKQSIEKQSCLQKLVKNNREMVLKMQLQKEQVEKWEKIKMRKVIQENEKETRQRLNLIRKSLRGYSLREESKQIKQIMRNHKQSIQFINNIEEIGNLSLHKTKTGSRYSTLDLTKLSKNAHLAPPRDSLEKIIGRNNKSQMKMYQESPKNLLSCRRSLVSLYDDQLREL